ncbi:hypothetical protein AAVH_00995 [Aphelenchoides avenae]|nr:hypothetical protein AAVH_00995 [Aphelenchus avenae]
MGMLYDTPGSGDEHQAELPASAPNYGVAICDARNAHDKSIYHKSDFYLGRVFKFREVDIYSHGAETSRHYRCMDCETVTEHVPQFMGKNPPLLLTVNGRYKHDPDRPQDMKHLCMTPGVPRDLLPVHFMPDSRDMAGQLRESSAAEDEDDDDYCQIIEYP